MTNAILAIGAVLAIIGIAIEMVVIEPARQARKDYEQANWMREVRRQKGEQQ